MVKPDSLTQPANSLLSFSMRSRRGGHSSNFSGFKEGLAVVRVNNKSRYIDKTGKMIIGPKYDYGNDFHSGVARMIDGQEADKQKLYYIDKTGKIIWEQKAN